MKTEKLLGLGILIIVIVAIAYFIGQSLNNQQQSTNVATVNNTNEQQVSVPAVQNKNSNSSTSAVNMDNSYYETGSESLCSQEAQQLADSFNQSYLQISKSFNLPAASDFVVSSHYVASQNSCYIELHELIPLSSNNTKISDDYTLYVVGGPSEWIVKSGILENYATVATCSTFTNSQTTCNYRYPVEKDQVSGSMSYTNWTDQYNANNAPPMSQQDFQSLVQSDMTAN